MADFWQQVQEQEEQEFELLSEQEKQELNAWHDNMTMMNFGEVTTTTSNQKEEVI